MTLGIDTGLLTQDLTLPASVELIPPAAVLLVTITGSEPDLTPVIV
jgi:hypothetical protein